MATPVATIADPAFRSAGKRPGLEIFRVEKLKVVEITDTSKFGKFHSGDSYIVLSTSKPDTTLRWDIYFWLGKDTSQDEAGVAAYKAVELDDALGGLPVQHRETEGSESQAFLNLFRPFGGIKYIEGGVDSGFKKVDRSAHEKRLFLVKGKRNVRVIPVEVSYKSLNHGDVFVLDCPNRVYQWNGKTSSMAERAKGFDVVREIRDNDHGGKGDIVIIDYGENDVQFFEDLGSRGPVPDAGEDDGDFERKKNAQLKLYRVSDATGSMKTTLVASAPLRKDMLDTSDAFVLDTAQTLFVWIGKKATVAEKSKAWDVANAFITEKKYPKSTPVTRLTEGAETSVFIQQFDVWPQPQSSANYLPKRSAAPVSAPAETKPLDYKALYGLKKESTPSFDDGQGKLKVWRVENFARVEVETSSYGQFYMGDSYVLQYSYGAEGRESYVIYFWQGVDSSVDEKGSSALLAKELDDTLGGRATQVRVVQNKETDHFLTLFKGKFIVLRGGHKSGFKNAQADGTEAPAGSVRLFRVHGTSTLNTKAIQVEEKAASLNSNDCFVLEAPGTRYVWFGKLSTGDERAVAKTVAEALAPPAKVETTFEGQEPEAFWTALGGKTEYFSATPDVRPLADPRLFQCSNASGKFTVEEIYDFAQEDLIAEDIMLLDSYDEVFIWIGTGANATEKKLAVETAAAYVTNAPDHRKGEDTPIVVVKQGFEPTIFTAHFPGWSAEKAKAGVVDYEALKAAVVAGNDEAVMTLTARTADATLNRKVTERFTLEKLQERPLPDGVDVAHLEQYLLETEFPRVFGKTQAEFLALPRWKRDSLKKEKKLF